MLAILLKYGKNKAKREKNPIFSSLKALPYKAFRPLLQECLKNAL